MGVHLEAGTVFAGDYRVVQQLGAGGMGAVYIVQQKSTGARRALKIMLPHLAANPEARERFEREAKVGARIPSDHVVQVLAAGVDEATQAPWIAMELLEGEPLDARVRRAGPIAAAEARDLFSQLGHALRAAHGVDIVHRDLKPENLHVGTGRREGDRLLLKVLDFGIAKLVSDAGDSGTAPIGTVPWMAPEQTSRTGISPATDVWAVGLIAFWSLTGKSYWRAMATGGGTIGEVLRELLVEALPPASERAREYGVAEPPAGFDAWFARAVARDPKARFAEGGEACDALVALLGAAADTSAEAPALDVASAPTALADPAIVAPIRQATAPGTSRRKPVFVGAMGVVALAAVTVLAASQRKASHDGASASASAPVTSAAAAPSVVPTAITALPPPACSNAQALALYASALQAGRDANWDRGVERLREAAELEPTCAMIQVRLARQQLGDARRASFARALEGRTQLNPRDRVLFDTLSVGEAATPPDLPAALNLAKRAVITHPGDAELFDLVCGYEENNARGIAACRRATELDPDYADAWSDLASSLKSANEREQALRALDRCLAVSPSSSRCLRQRAEVYDGLGKCAEREADLRKAVEIDPKSFDVHHEWTDALIARGVSYASALEATKQSIALMPQDRREIDGAFALSKLASEYGRWREQDHQLGELVRLLATSLDAHDQNSLAYARVRQLLDLGRKQEAAKVARDYFERREGWGAASVVATMFDLGIQAARLRAGELSLAGFRALQLEWVERVRRDVPRFPPWVLWTYAYVYWLEEGDDPADVLAVKPTGDPPDDDARFALGKTYVVAGRFAEALPLLRARENTCGERREAEVSSSLAKVLAETGSVAAACEIYGRIVERLGQEEPAPSQVKRARELHAKLACK